MDRPNGWVLFTTNNKLMTAIDLNQLRVVAVMTNDGTGGCDIRLTDGPNSFYVSVKNSAAECVEMIAKARSEVPQPVVPTLNLQR